MGILVVLIKLISILAGAAFIIGLVGGWLTAGGTNVSHGIRPSRTEPGSYVFTRIETTDGPWDYNHVFWIICGVGLVIALAMLGLAVLTGANTYMVANSELSAFCEEINVNAPDYQTAYGRLSDNIQNSYSEADFVKYLHDHELLSCTASDNTISFPLSGSVFIACDNSTSWGILGEVRINTFPFFGGQ
ncbi:MAG TPA: hypothetical protein VGT44_12960 [Ktedonobacteraceae bacterium]|nr:hypothetical protein [Ktedonobacteraceae bacterium]